MVRNNFKATRPDPRKLAAEMRDKALEVAGFLDEINTNSAEAKQVFQETEEITAEANLKIDELTAQYTIRKEPLMVRLREIDVRNGELRNQHTRGQTELLTLVLMMFEDMIE